MEQTKNSKTAKSGFRAEKKIVETSSLKPLLEAYFGKTISKLELQKHGKKSDFIMTFDDATIESVQNKDGPGSRGHSFDRRSLDKLTENTDALTLIRNLCLLHCGDRPEVEKAVSLSIIDRCMLGEEPRTRPTYITHSISTKSGDIAELYICEMEKFITHLKKTAYDKMVPKRTCVHLSDSIYLQRKGGKKGESRPEDIQAKIKFTPAIKALFTRVL